jgi:hypothetical protein
VEVLSSLLLKFLGMCSSIQLLKVAAACSLHAYDLEINFILENAFFGHPWHAFEEV